MGPSDLYVKTGSIVTLTCVVSQGPHELGTIYWYRGNTYKNMHSIIQNFNLISHLFLGSTILDPKASNHPNDATYDYPGRISVDTEWTDALRSR